MQRPGNNWAQAFQVILLCLLVVATSSACTSPEQKKKKREAIFQKFSTGVAKHLLDKNPITVRESMTHLFREELSEPIVETLQKQGQLPKTELGIVKIITEAEEKRTTNNVEVTSAKPLGPTDKEVVPYQVTGQVTTKTEGKPDQIVPFSMKITLKMDAKTGEWPQVIDIVGIPGQAQASKPPAKPEAPQKKKRHRRHN